MPLKQTTDEGGPEKKLRLSTGKEAGVLTCSSKTTPSGLSPSGSGVGKQDAPVRSTPTCTEVHGTDSSMKAVEDRWRGYGPHDSSPFFGADLRRENFELKQQMLEVLRKQSETDRKLNLLLDRELKEKETDLNLSPEMSDLSDEETESWEFKRGTVADREAGVYERPGPLGLEDGKEKNKEVDYESFQDRKTRMAQVSNLEFEVVQNQSDATMAEQELDADIGGRCQVLLLGMVVKQAIRKMNAVL